MFWTRKHQIESSNHEGFFKNFPCCRQFLQEFYKVQTNFVGFFHARCLNFPCFINYLAAFMHEFCMFYLYVSLGNDLGLKGRCCRRRIVALASNEEGLDPEISFRSIWTFKLIFFGYSFLEKLRFSPMILSTGSLMNDS